MAIVTTNIGTNSGAPSNGATVSITVPAGGVPSGSLIVLCVSATTLSGTVGTTNYSDTAGNTYTAAATKDNSSNRGIVLYAKNSTALSSGNAITFTNNSGASLLGAGFSAFYATGVDTTSPLDTAFTNSASGSSTSPSVAALAVPATASSLVVGAISTNAGSGDTFTQDSTHAAYATPPVRVGASSATIAGGSVVSSSQLTYAPTITSRAWNAIIVAFKPTVVSVPAKVVQIRQAIIRASYW